MTISKSGKIKAKKVGYGYIEVTSDGKTFRVLVQIAKKKAYQATRKAIDRFFDAPLYIATAFCVNLGFDTITSISTCFPNRYRCVGAVHTVQ